MKTLRVCAITMARNDDFFLNRWIQYYGKELGEENIYIYLDGVDQPIPSKAGKANVIHRERVVEHVVKAEKRRLGFLSVVASELLQRYDLVIGVDADEFLVVDPSTGLTLIQYLSSIKIDTCVSGLGMDVGQKLGEESVLDYTKPFLDQRKYAYLSPRYTKPSVISEPVQWGSGFHRVKGKNFRIDPNLYLFHFGSVDMEIIEQRFRDVDRMSTGRKKHIEKRAKTIHIITKNRKAALHKFWIEGARLFQSYIRQWYAWNKPTMLMWKLVIRIPEQFKGTV